MPRTARPCMACNELLDANGDCSTAGCAYNPREDTVTHDTDLKVGDEIDHKGGGDYDGEDPLGDMDESELDELLNDDTEPYDFERDADTDELEGVDDAPHSDRDEVAEDSDKMDLSQEDLPEQEREQKPSDRESKDEDDPLAEQDVTEHEFDDAPEDSETKKVEDDLEGDERANSDDKRESDEPLDQGDQDEDDPDLPPRPRGCEGNCQPNDDPSEGDEPCPHCTAKSFKEQMEQEGKENLPEDEMQQEMDNFLDEWNRQAQEDGNGQGQDDGERQTEGEDGEQPDYDQEIGDEQNRQDEIEDERKEREDQGDDKDDDLPPRPQGCSGDCQPGDDPDGETCPHCTAKQFKLSLEQKGMDQDDLSEEDFEKMLDEFRKNWEKEGEQKKKEQFKEELEEQHQEQDTSEPCAKCGEKESHLIHGDDGDGSHEYEAPAPPEDELNDLPENEQKKKDYDDGEDEDEEKPEFKRMATKMTVTQEKRFDNLVERLEKKVEQTFGLTAEDVFTMSKQKGQFEGEELSQSIQISSRGVTYWVTIAAAKEM